VSQSLTLPPPIYSHFLHPTDTVSKLPEDDDISNDTINESNVTHFPLEISTDDGGVSALLPSGQILVDRTGGASDCNIQSDGELAEAAGRLLSRMKCEDAVVSDKTEKCEEDDNGVGAVSSTDNSMEEAPRHSNHGPECPEEEPPTSETQWNPRNPQSSQMALGTPYPLGSKGKARGKGAEVTPTPGEEEEGAAHSLLQVLTTSSSVSEDPTFNSYAPSEMSSMMSHLEIQHLLKQGRQQEQDYDMVHNNNYHRGPPTRVGGGGLPDTVMGGVIGRPTMVLYSNQSLYALKKERNRGGRGDDVENHEGGRPLSEAMCRRPLPSSSSSRTVPLPLPAGDNSSTSRDFLQVQPAPSSSSSSSHGLLRVDAMEDERSYLSNNDRLRSRGGLLPSAAGGGPEDEYYRISHPPSQQHQRQQQEQEQFYPHLLGQASTLTTMPSMSSTITSVQSARHPLSSNHGGSNNHAIYLSHGVPSPNQYVAALPPPQMRIPPTARIGGDFGGDEKEEDEDTFFHELKSASPLRSCASTAPSVVEEDSIEGVGVRVEVEVGLKQHSDSSSSDPEEDNGGMVIATAPSQSLSQDGGSFRTSSTDGRRSVQSLLGTSTKSLADDLIQHDEESGSGESEFHKEGGNIHNGNHLGGTPVNDVDKGQVTAAVKSLHWNANPLTQQSSFPYVPSSYIDPSPSVGGDDGYSADQSTSYALENANRIEEYSTSANSYFGGQRDLQQGLPMVVGSEDDTENSHHHHFGYGHNYNHEPLPLAYSNNKPMGAIPSTFPSLMDASVSSALTASTAPSVARGFVFGSVASTQQRRNGENEEREDSLPLTTRNYDTVPQQMDLMVNAAIGPQHQVDAAMRHHDPLTSTSPAMLSAEDEVALPVATHEMPPPSALNDPRMNVDYERHYIVDLERINEESSGHHDLSSAGGRRFDTSGSVSSPRTSSVSSPRASSPRATSISPPPRRASAGDVQSAKGHGMGTSAEFQRGQSPVIPEAYISQKQQPLPSNSPKPTQFYNYRHQYYTEQYHYCDERFFQADSKVGNGNGGDCDDSDSTCSSVTLSQAFRHSNDGNESTCSSITDTECYSESHATHASTVSSVTLSCALSVDKHVHSDQGFYVATRLGDFVEVPNEGSDGEEDDENDCYGVVGDEAMNTMNDGPAYFSTVYEGDEESASIEVEKSVDPHGIYSAALDQLDVLGAMASVDDNVTMTTNGTTADISNKSAATTEYDEIDAISDCALGSKGHLENSSNNDSGQQKKNAQDAAAAKVAATQIASAKADDIESDILSALVPECGAAIPSVIARIGGSKAPGRSKGGMLLPWHSTRSIQNYQGRRGKNKKGSNASLYSSRSRDGSLFSIGSVHTFRG